MVKARITLESHHADMESLENVWGIVIHYEQKWSVEE